MRSHPGPLYAREASRCGFRRRRTAIPIEAGQRFRSIADTNPMIADRRPVDGGKGVSRGRTGVKPCPFCCGLTHAVAG